MAEATLRASGVRDSADSICATVVDLGGNLQERSARLWASDVRAHVSYPQDAHHRLKQIEENSYWFAHRNAIIATMIRKFPPCGPILDIGGGNGFVARHLQTEGWETLVVEASETGAAISHERGVPTVCAEFAALSPKANHFEAAALFDVIEHVEDDLGALRRIWTMLRPGGRLFLTTPAHQWLWSQEDTYAGHFRRYTIERLRRLVKQAGFELDYASYCFGFLVLPIALLRALPSRLNCRSGGATIEAEHKAPAGLVGVAMRSSFQHELRFVREGRALGLGTTCLLAAHKRSSSGKGTNQ